MLAKARVARIGAAALGAGIARIAAAWAAALRIAWITAVAAVSGTAAMVAALIAAVVASESTAHPIAQHSFKQSHDLLLSKNVFSRKNCTLVHSYSQRMAAALTMSVT